MYYPVICVFRHVSMAFQIVADKTLVWPEIIFDLKLEPISVDAA